MTNKWGRMLSFIWSVKEDLRGPYKSHQYGQVILPLVVLRRLDATLGTPDPRDPTRTRKQAVLDRASRLEPPYDNHADLLKRVASLEFYNTSKYDFGSLLGDENALLENVNDYLLGFSPDVREVIEAFDLKSHIERLARADRLYAVLGRFADAKVDLDPTRVTNLDMGYIYEELLREVNALQKETAGEHFTPREVIDLMVSLLVAETEDLMADGKVVTVYDPTAGTGGMLTTAEYKLLSLNPRLRVHLRGQEIQEESFAICRSDMLIRGEQTAIIRREDTLKRDLFADEKFDYVIANPPYGTDWKNAENEVRHEHRTLGLNGRFGPGLPSTDDGQMLFLLHMFSKLKSPEDGGGRLAVVMNGSPLFAGDAGSGPSEIRRFFIENDYLEAIIGLPDEMFYNTGIYTYVWVVSNRKRPDRQGLVQLIDARDLCAKMAKSLGNKRNRFTPANVAEILGLYEGLVDEGRSKILPLAAFGYRAVTVERPMRVSWRLRGEECEAIASLPAMAKLASKERDAAVAAAWGLAPWESSSAAETDGVVDTILSPIPRPTKAIKDAVRKVLERRDPAGVVVHETNGLRPDPQLRETELVPLTADVDDYFKREVEPYAPGAWVAPGREKIGYEIAFTKLFYEYRPPRPLAEIDADFMASQERILALLRRDER